jgi:hypothetical protein
MAAVGIGIGLGDQVRADGIEMEIANQGEQIRVFFTDDGVISPLKEMADFSMGAIEILGIGLLEPLHERRERQRACFDQQVHVIGHQTVGPQPGLTGLEIASQPLEIGVVIGGGPKRDLPVVPPAGRVSGAYKIVKKPKPDPF